MQWSGYLASYRSRIGHAAGKRLCQEMGAQLLDWRRLVESVRNRVSSGPKRTRRSHGLSHGVGSQSRPPGEIGKEPAGGSERGIVGRGAETEDGLRRQRAGLAFTRDFLGGLAHLVGKRRDHCDCSRSGHSRNRSTEADERRKGR